MRLQGCISCERAKGRAGIVQEEEKIRVAKAMRHSIGRAPILHEPQAVLPAVLAVNVEISRTSKRTVEGREHQDVDGSPALADL